MISPELNDCITMEVMDARRYKDSCHLYYLVNERITSDATGQVVSIENEPKRVTDGKTCEIDALLQCGGKHSILELKTSVRNHETDLMATINQLKERDCDFHHNQDIYNISHLILLCHRDDVEKLRNKFDELIKGGFTTKKSVVFLTWEQYIDKGHVEKYCIKFHSEYEGTEGKVTNSFVDSIKKTELKKQVAQTAVFCEIQKFIFTNKRPCSPYLFHQVRGHIQETISPVLQLATAPETLDIGTVADNFNSFKSKKGNDLVKPKTAWFRESLEILNRLGWIKLDGQRIIVNLGSFAKLRKQNDDFHYFAKTVCRDRIARAKRLAAKKKAAQSKHPSTQKSVFDF